VLASCPACLLNSPAAALPKSLAPAIDKRIITVQLVANRGPCMACLEQQHQRARRASSARPLRLAARWLSSIRSASVSTMVFSMNTIILPFQLLQSTRANRRAWAERSRRSLFSDGHGQRPGEVKRGDSWLTITGTPPRCFS